LLLKDAKDAAVHFSRLIIVVITD